MLNFDEVIDQQLILFVSLNINRNTRAVTALGRMLLQDLQLMVGKRYGSSRNFLDDGPPMVSVILDELAPFASVTLARKSCRPHAGATSPFSSRCNPSPSWMASELRPRRHFRG